MNEPIIWNERRVELRDGDFWLSRKSQYDDFDIEAGDPEGAVAGNVGFPKSPIYEAAVDGDNLNLMTFGGVFVLIGRFEDGSARITLKQAARNADV